jgi:hypothetical protein
VSARQRAKQSRSTSQSRPEQGSGRPLDASVRGPFEAQLGHSFADVRVHVGPSADDSAGKVGADAFTMGRDIFFRAGRYAPGSRAGRALLAHELAHTVQQRGGGLATGRISTPTDPAEHEAEAAARAVDAGARFVPRLLAPAHVARQASGAVPSQPLEAPVAPATETVAPVRAEAAPEGERRATEEAFRAEQVAFAHDRVDAASFAMARQVGEMNAKPVEERAPYRAKITALERQLVHALEGSIPILEQRVAQLQSRAARGEDVRADLASAQKELADNKGDLERLAGAFTPEKGEAFEKAYETKLAGAACMKRAYEGLGVLHSPEKAAEIQKTVEAKAERTMKRTGVDIDQFITVMDTVSAAKMAGPKNRARWSKSRKTWTPTLESIIRPKIHPTAPAFYFFGLALAEAYHSVIVGVSTWGDSPKTLWCDQSGCSEVAGSLDDYARAEAESYQIGYADWDTYIWQIVPPAEASLLAQKQQEPK